MSDEQTIAYLSMLPMVEALWWYIENVESGTRPAVFFALRERMRA